MRRFAAALRISNAEEMDPEDGQLWVVGVGEDGVMAFTEGVPKASKLVEIGD